MAAHRLEVTVVQVLINPTKTGFVIYPFDWAPTRAPIAIYRHGNKGVSVASVRFSHCSKCGNPEMYHTSPKETAALAAALDVAANLAQSMQDDPDMSPDQIAAKVGVMLPVRK